MSVFFLSLRIIFEQALSLFPLVVVAENTLKNILNGFVGCLRNKFIREEEAQDSHKAEKDVDDDLCGDANFCKYLKDIRDECIHQPVSRSRERIRSADHMQRIDL